MPDASVQHPTAEHPATYRMVASSEAASSEPPAPSAGRSVLDPISAAVSTVRMALGGSVVASALIGFVVGAVFWHFIGFWGFVRDVVLRGPDQEVRQSAQTGIHCTSVILDRETGRLSASTCPSDAPWMQESGPLLTKTDSAALPRLHPPKRWSVTVEAETPRD